jgi:hypothetical protein
MVSYASTEEGETMRDWTGDINRFYATIYKCRKERRTKDVRARIPEEEWSRKRYLHPSMLETALAHGIIEARKWQPKRNAVLPPGFETVVNWISYNVRNKFGSDQIVLLSLDEVVELLRKWAGDSSEFRQWEEDGILDGEMAFADAAFWIDGEALLMETTAEEVAEAYAAKE